MTSHYVDNRGRIIIVQPALPRYRIGFFDDLAAVFPNQMEVHYSPMSMGAIATEAVDRPWAYPLGPVRTISPGLFWQRNVSKIRFGSGDVIVVPGNPRLVSTLWLVIAARNRGAKVVWWGHLWSSSSREWLAFLRRLIMRLADAVLFYTDEEVRLYLSSLGTKPGLEVTALNNGVDLSRIVPQRKPYRSRQRRRAVFFIGRLTEKSRFDLLLEALAILGHDAIEVHVVGDGPEEDWLKRRAEVLGVSGSIIWHGGHVDEELISAIANECRLFVYPGEVGLSLVHAMAYGLPAVVHSKRKKHMPEIAAFVSGRTGRTFAYNQPSSLAQTLAESLDAHDFLDDASSAAVRVVEESFNTKVMVERFLALMIRLQRDRR